MWCSAITICTNQSRISPSLKKSPRSARCLITRARSPPSQYAITTQRSRRRRSARSTDDPRVVERAQHLDPVGERSSSEYASSRSFQQYTLFGALHNLYTVP